MVPAVTDFEKLGVFYLGRRYDLEGGALRDELLLYDSKDLCTHALCVGMTGSGKTGLCISLLEEAAMDRVPVLCVDPKGDLANLMLTFPELKAEDFEPWLEAAEATRHGKTVKEMARDTAKLWREGLATWGQGPERIAALRAAAEVSVYTPGSTAGIPLTVLRNFDAPTAAVLADADAMRERIAGATSGLLALLGLETDPLLSREHILVASILDHCWRAGRSVSIAEMIGLIQTPPMERVGVLDLESFMPVRERAELAMRLNNLLASPSFATWLEGEPLDIQKLLYDDEGQPRVAVLSIAHLSEQERMFFVTILLNELVAWMREQSGTSALRALFYMDEVMGYFPPTAKPPSKPPMMTLLKQARAYGLGVVLATQNPVDLDYKGLSNIGTWFLGRLQTERDKQRVLAGLEGAAAQSGQTFDRQRMEQTLAGLGKRVFLMNNVHEDGPQIFQTRWAMSFLAGPLARDQLARLTAAQKEQRDRQAEAPHESMRGQPLGPQRPVVPAGVEERFLAPQRAARAGVQSVYRPAVWAEGSLHYVRRGAKVDLWRDEARWVMCGEGVPDPLWESSHAAPESFSWAGDPEKGFSFAELPGALRNADRYERWGKSLKDYLYRHSRLVLYKAPVLGEYAPAGCSEAEARLALTQHAREARDRETEKLRAKYAGRMERLDRRIRSAEERVARERDQYQAASMSSVISLGQSILGALMGNKMRSRSTVSRVGSLARGASRASRQRGDVERAEASLKELSAEMMELDAELRGELEQVAAEYAVEQMELEVIRVTPRKGDLKTSSAVLVWTPWQLDEDGTAEPLY